jgi:hypothetical protein
MISSTIVSPFLTASTAPARSSAPAAASVAEQPTAAPADLVTTSGAAEAPPTDGARMSLAKRGGVAVMAGVALLGAGLLAPTAASAQPMRGHFGHSQVYHRGGGYYGGGFRGYEHHRGGINPGVAFGLGVLGGMILNQTVPPPVVVTPGYPGPVDYGSNGYGCDGVYHHFDSYGNVSDASGHYRLMQNGWGQCYRTPAQPY